MSHHPPPRPPRPKHKPQPFHGSLRFYQRGKHHPVGNATFTPQPPVPTDQDLTLTVYFTQLPASAPAGTAPTIIPPIVVPISGSVVPTASIPCNPGDTISAYGAYTNAVGTTDCPVVSGVDPTPPPTTAPQPFTGALTFS
jgi:hypothetical protein